MAAYMYLDQVGEFMQGTENWMQYAERLRDFMAANSVLEAEWRRDVFLFVIGSKEYQLLGSW